MQWETVRALATSVLQRRRRWQSSKGAGWQRRFRAPQRGVLVVLPLMGPQLQASTQLLTKKEAKERGLYTIIVPLLRLWEVFPALPTSRQVWPRRTAPRSTVPTSRVPRHGPYGEAPTSRSWGPGVIACRCPWIGRGLCCLGETQRCFRLYNLKFSSVEGFKAGSPEWRTDVAWRLCPRAVFVAILVRRDHASTAMASEPRVRSPAQISFCWLSQRF